MSLGGVVVVVQLITLSLLTLVGLSWDVDMLLSDLEKAKEDTPSISDYVLLELIFGSTF